ncbi:MAG: D-glucuronyl C5-epimerase family protein [Thermoleophilaceae bacterium]
MYSSRYARAREALRRLSGTRAAELRAVVGGAEKLAAGGRLSAGRMPAVFLELVRNERFWSRRGAPDPGRRFSFGRDPVILQYYPGQGLRIQPLASAAEANRLYNACRGYKTRPGTPCRKRTLGRLLDRLVELAARRGDFKAWEYYFPFSGGSAPWVSGMAQGTVIQALARGHRHLGGDDGYLDAAREGLGAFETPAPAGVAVPAPGGTHYAMYSQRPGLKVLNGFLQAVAGLQTYARVSGERRAWALFRAGDAAAQHAVPSFDTGGWSLYSKPGGESTVEYHRLVRDFLGNLCRRDGGRVYCRTERRFTSYVDEPPRLHVRPIRGARRGRPLRVRFRLSRNALVTVSARSEGGKTVFGRSLRLRRGSHEVRWTPRGSQHYRVKVSARDRRGKRASSSRLARVR